MTSGSYASPNAILFGFTNNTGSTLGSISLSFDFERYRINAAVAAVTFFTSTNGTTWTANTAGDSGAFATGTSAYNFATGTTVSKSLTIAGLDLAVGSSYYLRWTFNTTGSNSQGIGLDNFVMSQTAAATPLFWAGPGWTANGAGGSGTWDGTGNWDATTANFGGTAGTVTVGTVNATGLSFSNTTSAYTLNSGTITLTGATVSVTSGAVSATINSVLAGAVGFTKAGAGAMTIGGANSYTGATNVDAGSLTTSGGAGRLGSANALSVATGATLVLGGNESAATVTNTGAIDLGANTLTSGGGTSVGNFSGTGGSLIFSGSATLSGTNNYTGGTTVNAGTLTVSTTTALPTAGAIVINAASQLKLNVAGTFGDPGQTLTLNADQAATPILGTLSAATITLQSNVVLATGTTNRIEPSSSAAVLTLAGNLTGAGNLSKAASGNLTLSGTANTNTGTTQIGNGTITVNSGSALGTGSLTFFQTSTNAATIALNNATQSVGTLTSSWTALTGTIAQTLTLNGTALTINQNSDSTFGAGAVSTLSSVITGTGSIIKAGAGTLTLSSTNTFSGGTTLTAGTLGLGSGTALGTGGLTINGGTLAAITVARNVANNLTVGGDFTLGGQGFSTTFNGTVDLGGATRSITLANTATINGVISNGGLSLSISAGGSKTLILSGTNTFTGGTTISAGTLQVGAGGATGTLAGAITNNAALVFNHSGPITADNLISGTGSVTKQGAGILTLSGANTYTGTSTISAGTLLVGHLTALGTGAVTVSGGILDLNTANLGGQIANVITVTSGSVINGITASAADTAGTVAVTTVLTGAADLTKTTAGTLTLSTPHFHTGATVANTAGVVIKASHLADTGSSLGAGTLSDPTKLQLGAGAVLEFTGATTTSSTRSFTLTDSAGITTAVGAAGLTFTSAAKIALSGATPALALVANNSVTNIFRASLSDADIAAGNGLKTLTIDGAGVWVIGGSSNRFKGDIRIEVAGGTIGLESGALPTGAGTSAVIALANNARVRYEAGNTDDLSGKLSLVAGTTGKLDLGNNNVAFNSALAVAAGTGSTATLTKEGAGKLTIAAGNNTNLNLSVTAGTLVVNSSLGNVSLAAETTLGGSGTVGAVTTVSGSTISPGNSPGNLTSSSLALVGGSTFQWQVQDATGGAGTGYDTLTVTNALDLSGASSGNRIILNISSLAGNGNGTALGNPLNFSPSSIRPFTFATVGSLNLGSNTNINDAFTITVGDFKYTDGSSSNAGLWSLSFADNTVTLTAVPEPSTYGLGLGALALAAAAIRRRKQKAKA